MTSSVRPILRIGEYSLVALQYRRIRYIGLRVSADTDAPAAITINSNLTRRLKHMVRVDRMWLQMRLAFLFTFRRTDCRCNTSRHQRHPAALHAAWCFNYRYAGQTHASVSKGQTDSWSLTLPRFKQASIHYVSTSRSMFRRRATRRPHRPIAFAYKRTYKASFTQTSHSCHWSSVLC